MEPGTANGQKGRRWITPRKWSRDDRHRRKMMDGRSRVEANARTTQQSTKKAHSASYEDEREDGVQRRERRTAHNTEGRQVKPNGRMAYNAERPAQPNRLRRGIGRTRSVKGLHNLTSNNQLVTMMLRRRRTLAKTGVDKQCLLVIGSFNW